MTGSGGVTGTGSGGVTGSGGTNGTGGAKGGSTGTGGTSSGGSTGSGGVIGAGGLKGSGGVSGSGGVTGTGGAKGGSTGTGGTSSGGTTGLGGVIGSGGLKGSGGVTGLGGVAGTGGANGGSTGTGGTSSGGSTGSGGVLGTGGLKGSGGTNGMGGAKGGSTGTGGTSGGGTRGSGGTTGAGGATSACMQGSAWSGGKTYSSNTQGNVGNGYSYQLWRSGSSGSMIVAGVDAKFSATWDNSGDFLARVGLGWNSSQTYDQLGTIGADYAYTKTGGAGGYSYIGIYGWSENPLHEYYIVDDWFGSGPPTGGGSKVGTFSVDGGTYNVYTHTQTNQPAITGGNATFVQYFSVRQTARQCGHISISEHFKEWANLGLTLGKMEEARILVEVGGGSGDIDFTTATVTAE